MIRELVRLKSMPQKIASMLLGAGQAMKHEIIPACRKRLLAVIEALGDKPLHPNVTDKHRQPLEYWPDGIRMLLSWFPLPQLPWRLDSRLFCWGGFWAYLVLRSGGSL